MNLPNSIRMFERGWLSANTIAFVEHDALDLMDTGYVTHSEQALALIDSLEGVPAPQRIFNTHLHSDHCGGNAAIQARWPRVQTFVPQSQLADVQAWDVDALEYRRIGQQCPRYRADGGLKAGDELELGGLRWAVFAAPGHDNNSLMFWNAANGILISADALWERGCGVIFPELKGETGFRYAQETLDFITSLEAKVVIPGHGRIFGGEQIQASISYAKERLDYLSDPPSRNIDHGLRALLKFHLLEVRAVPQEELLAWATELSFMKRAESLTGLTAAELVEKTVSKLIRIGAASISPQGEVLNQG
jgi:glyoxylase-like metal-dependent hydrolase (beta-lactamase superfamily II)